MEPSPFYGELAFSSAERSRETQGLETARMDASLDAGIQPSRNSITGAGAPAHEAGALAEWLVSPAIATSEPDPSMSATRSISDGVALERLRARDMRYARWQRVLVQDAEHGFRNLRRMIRQEGVLLAESEIGRTATLEDLVNAQVDQRMSEVGIAGAVGRVVTRLSEIASASAPFAPEVRALRSGAPVIVSELVAGYVAVFAPSGSAPGLANPLAKRVAELAALEKINAVINSSLDLSVVLDQAVEVVSEVMRVDTANVYLLEEGNRLVLRATTALNQDLVARHSLGLGEGITGWTAEHGRPVTVEDAWRDERFRYVPSLDEEPYHGWLSVPIILFRAGENAAGGVANTLIGVLSLMTREIKAFTDQEVAFVETVAGQLAIAIENARLYGLTDERLREKVQQLEALQRVTATLVSSLDLSEVLRQMARQAAIITNTDMAGIFELNDRTQRLHMVASFNLSETYADIAVPVGDGAIGLAVAQRAPVVILDAQTDPRLQAPSVARWVIEEGYRSMFSVPLISRGRTLGGVSVYTRERRVFTQDQIHMLTAFANDAAIAIENARLYAQTRQALDMKSVLLQELHHRVKNNLQMMASLIRLQMRRTHNDEAKRTLGVTYSQIESLGAAHDLLSQDTGASGTTMGRATVGEIARRVADIAVADLLPHDKRIEIHTADAQVDVGSDRATLLALILNELICNAILHGLEDRTTGSVVITAAIMPPTRAETSEIVEIRVVDDGAGLPPGFSLNASAGLGLAIVQRLVVEQLRGELTIENVSEPDGAVTKTGTCARLRLRR